MLKSSQQVTQIKHLGAGVYREWIADGRVCVMLSTQAGREATDIWAKSVKDVFDRGEIGKPLYLIFDNAAVHAHLTPYNQQKVMEVAAYRPDIVRYIAIIAQENLFGKVIKTFVDQLRFPYFTAKVFFSRGAGEAWIMEMLQHEATPPPTSP